MSGARPLGPAAPPWTLPAHPGAFAPRRSNAGAIVATVLVLMLVGAAGLIGAVTVSGRKHHVADTRYDYPDTSNEPTGSTAGNETDATTSRAGRATTTTRPSTTSGRAPTTTTRSTSSTPSGPRPVAALGENPLFGGDLGTPAVTCALARWHSDAQSAAAFFTSALPCLEAAWAPVLQRAGLPYFPPSLQAPAGNSATGPCGGAAGRSFAAFYCPKNHTIYMPFGALQTERLGAHPGVYLAVLAHEYGHHVQALSGVEDAYWAKRYDAGADTEAGLELSRRLELQAQCFSGMFLAATYSRGSVDKNILQEARTTQNRGDHTAGEPRDHGSDAHATSWWEQGAQKNRTFQCNTWRATAAEVA
ncbi:MAG: neutral zinc metallopeptidase [Labedaea sp.]